MGSECRECQEWSAVYAAAERARARLADEVVGLRARAERAELEAERLRERACWTPTLAAEARTARDVLLTVAAGAARAGDGQEAADVRRAADVLTRAWERLLVERDEARAELARVVAACDRAGVCAVIDLSGQSPPAEVAPSQLVEALAGMLAESAPHLPAAHPCGLIDADGAGPTCQAGCHGADVCEVARRRETQQRARRMHYDPMPGESIDHAAAMMVRFAAPNNTIIADFNGIRLAARHGTTPESIVATYTAESEKRAAAWRASPKGQAFARRQEAAREAAQREAERLMESLGRLDFNDLAAVIEWCEDMQGPSDHAGVEFSRQAVVEEFEAHGYITNANCGEDFSENDRDVYGRWIVGQALAGLRGVGAIHGAICDFAEKWRARFERKDAPGQEPDAQAQAQAALSDLRASGATVGDVEGPVWGEEDR